MILLSKADQQNPVCLERRREHVKSLLDEARPRVGPSSEEWVSSEFWAGRNTILREEIRDIDKQLQRLREREGKNG